MALKVVSRKQWHALPAKETTPLFLPATKMSFRYTESDTCRDILDCMRVVRAIQKQAMDQGLPDLPYNFLLGGDMAVYEGRGWHTKVSENCLVVAYIGKENGDDNYNGKVMASGYNFMRYASLRNYLIPFDNPPGYVSDVSRNEPK